MTREPSADPSVRFGLSARLLVLTVLFVMLAEVLIFVPSVSRFRQAYLEDQLEKANIAVLAARGDHGTPVEPGLGMELLFHAGAYAIVLDTGARRLLMLKGDMPPVPDEMVDMRGVSPWRLIAGAFDTLVQTHNRVLRVVGAATGAAGGSLEVILDETPLREAMYGYAVRILTLSVIISLITAGLVYLSLQWLMVRPIRQITASMMAFRADPEGEDTALPASRRSDEIGLAQRELAVMQSDLRAALRQKRHLVALGAAVARINHDLRNTLATAVLASDRLAEIDDPEVKRIGPRLYAAIDRAVSLCSRTLAFARDPRTALEPGPLTAGDLVADLQALAGADTLVIAGRGLETALVGDRAQLGRVIANLAENARQAGAHRLTLEARHDDGRVEIDVTDDGPGVPDTVRGKLFQPFESSGRDGGTGLGLAIGREIMSAHDGDLVLLRTGPGGTTFRLDLPAAAVPGGIRAS